MNAPSSSSSAASKKKSKHPSLIMDDPPPDLAATRLRISTRAHIAGLRRLSERANSSPRESSASTSSSSSSRSKVSFSFSGYGQDIIQQLQSCGVRIDPGLTEEEIERIQATFQFTFPPDLRGILQQGLPVGPGFPDWRSQLNSQKLRLWISSPKSALCSGAELGSFWWRGWGAPPADSVRAARCARAALRRAPPLIPVYGCCYVPAAPHRAGNPVIFFGTGLDAGCYYYCARDVGEFFSKPCFRSFVGGECPAEDGDHHVYVPEPMTEARTSSSSLECTRRMIARCRSSVGEEERSSSVSARSVLTGGRASSSYGSRSSDGSSDDGTAGAAAPAVLGMMAGKRLRRIEFWSDLIEKGPVMNSASGWEDGFLELHQQQDCCCEGGDDEHGGDAWEVVKSSVVEMGEKLRSAGWNEQDVGEIMESAESMSRKKSVGDLIDRQSVLEALATQLDFLSSCLREAGWSLNDITESLCLDLSGFSEPPSARSMRKLSPEVASRIGVLAAFVAQG